MASLSHHELPFQMQALYMIEIWTQLSRMHTSWHKNVHTLTRQCTNYKIAQVSPTGIILCMHPAKERWSYIVTSSLIGWVHTQIDPSSKASMATIDLQECFAHLFLKFPSYGQRDPMRYFSTSKIYNKDINGILQHCGSSSALAMR